MINVNVSISGILMCCDESLSNLSLGRGYTIEKCNFDTLFFKNKITDGRGFLNSNYFGSRIVDNDNVFFICLKKDEVIQIELSNLSETTYVLSNENFMLRDKINQYINDEKAFIYELINLLRIFKAGNIGFLDMFFRFSYAIPRLFFSNKHDYAIQNSIRNTISNDRFTLNDTEIIACNQWLDTYCNAPYALLKNSISMFSIGLEQIDLPTGFEKFTTALEMTLLPRNQSGKKQMLANRISVMLGNTPTEVQCVHQKILDFYRYRSESLHEGDGSNITRTELYELENITRNVLKKCLIRCKNEYDLNSNVTWDEIKNMITDDLINQVELYKNLGVLPS